MTCGLNYCTGGFTPLGWLAFLAFIVLAGCACEWIRKKHRQGAARNRARSRR